MRKIKMLNRISIDGYFASPNEASFGMDWFVHDPEVDQAAHSIGGRMSTLILGGTTYRGFERSWVPILHDPQAPGHLKEIAEELTDMTKIVFSTTIKSSRLEKHTNLRWQLNSNRATAKRGCRHRYTRVRKRFHRSAARGRRFDRRLYVYRYSRRFRCRQAAVPERQAVWTRAGRCAIVRIRERCASLSA